MSPIPNRTRRRLARLVPACAALALAAAAGPLAAQPADDWPTRPVKLIVSYGAGNVADVLARIVAQKLSEQIRQPVIVENRPGQGGSLGAQTAVKAPADGYTLLFSAMAAIAINPHVYARVGYDPIADLVPITAIAQTGSGIMYVTPDLKANTLAELIAASRAAPGTMNYGTAGSGTVPHLNMELLKGMSGLDATHIPYKAASAVLTDVVGGRIQMAQESSAVVLPQVKAGKVRAIAIVGTERMPELKDVPAITETVPGYDPVRPWMGVLAPAGVAPARVARIHAAVSAAIGTPDVRERIAAADLHLLDLGPAEFARTVKRDLDRYGGMVRTLKLQAD
jgi:tripartite-type tricarboxylate transporter receptor subunit TctC